MSIDASTGAICWTMQAVLRQGGLMAVLSFLDFFQTSVQRVAVATAAAMCRGLSADSVEAVSSAVPILTNILQYEVCAGVQSIWRPTIKPCSPAHVTHITHIDLCVLQLCDNGTTGQL